MIQRTLTGVTVAGLTVALVLYGSGTLQQLVCLMAAALAFREFDRMFFPAPSVARQLRELFLGCLAILVMRSSMGMAWVFLWLPLFVTAIQVLLRAGKGPDDFERSTRGIALEILGVYYVVSTVGFLMPTVEVDPFGRQYLLLLFFVVFAGDTFAYFVGSLWGRRKLARAISPKKSVEGAAGAIAGAMLFAVLWALFIYTGDKNRYFWVTLLSMVPLVSILAQLGDLFESLLKRSCAQKDSGHLLPGHGGILDRIDGLTFTAPLFYFWVRYFWGDGMKRLAIFGSTGTIGLNTAELARRFPERFQVVALTAGKNLDLLRAQVREFQPRVLVLQDAADAALLSQEFPGCEVLWGESGLVQCARWDGIDIACQGILGFAALAPTLELIRTGKAVALANKESLVVAGSLLRSELEKAQAPCIPVDSEHNAIFQLLEGRGLRGVESLVLTASGGPFWNRPEVRWEDVTVEQAVRHPKWKMGPKISVDSATLMNKGLEIVEAHFLFGVALDRIEAWVHPQSIVHGAVWYTDGTCQAQLSRPDMKASISHALGFPERLPGAVAKLTLAEMARLDFLPPDTARFPLLDLPRRALAQGQSSLIALNAGNEIGVGAFLEGRLRFSQLAPFLMECLQRHAATPVDSLDAVFEIDKESRMLAHSLLPR